MKKTVLITGTSSGFGKATTRYFSKHKWNVVATMRTPAKETELNTMPDVLVTRLDVMDKHSIKEAINAGIVRFGKIDAVINNAGFGLFGIFEGTPPDKIKEQFDVNVFGLMNVTRGILPHFRQNKSGLVINISSGAGVFTLPMSSLYCASKFAVEGFSEALAYELAPQNILVKIIEPGGVITTNFGERSAEESLFNTPVEDYNEFVMATNQLFVGLRSARLAREEDVASAIFGAATDGTNKIRYVATPDIGPMVQSRRETSEDQYIAAMREKFGYKKPA